MDEVIAVQDRAHDLFLDEEMRFRNDRVIITKVEQGLRIHAKTGKDMQTGKRSVEQVLMIHKKIVQTMEGDKDGR